MKSLAATSGRDFAAVMLLGLMASSGCTICPNPYAYSGPVPNGSVTQNDFCARSGGTRPLHSAPLVWPQVVQAEGTPAETHVESEGFDGRGDGQADQSVLLATDDELSDSNRVIMTSGEAEVDDLQESQEPVWRKPVE